MVAASGNADKIRHMDIPIYALYGERQGWPTPGLVHCESIAARSRLHDWHIAPHQHSGLFQILYLERGTARVQLDGEESGLSGGALLVVPQNHVHGFRFDRDAEGVVLTIAYSLLNKLTAECGTAAFVRPGRHRLDDGDDAVELRHTIASFRREYGSGALHRHLLLESLLQTLLILLSRCLTHQQDQHRPANRGSQDQAQFGRFCALLEQRGISHRLSRSDCTMQCGARAHARRSDAGFRRLSVTRAARASSATAHRALINRFSAAIAVPAAETAAFQHRFCSSANTPGVTLA